MSINDTMARLRELAKVIHKGDWNGYDTGHTIEVFGSIPVLLDYIGELEATIAKHERREDEHCRQIDRKDMKIRSLELILAVQPRHLGD